MSSEENIQQRYRTLATQEYEHSSQEIKINGPVKTYKAFLQRLTESQKNVLENTKEQLACQEGCAYCCSHTIGTFPVEVFRILEYVRANFDQEKKNKLTAKITARANELKPLNKEQRLSLNKPCVFLEDGCCGIYEVRPATCRNHHALDVDKCKQSIDEPENLSIPNTFIEELHMVNEAHTYGFKNAVEHSSHDASFYELNIALHEAINNSKCKKKWTQGKRPFSAAAHLSS
jgi:Fe-S-cluster containining protein